PILTYDLSIALSTIHRAHGITPLRPIVSACPPTPTHTHPPLVCARMALVVPTAPTWPAAPTRGDAHSTSPVSKKFKGSSSATELSATDKQSEQADSPPATPTDSKLDSAPPSHRSSHEPVSASVAAAALAPFFGSTGASFSDQAQSDF